MDLEDGRLAIIAPEACLPELAAAITAVVPSASAGHNPDLLDPVVILTVRQAKGLAFDSVLIADPIGILRGSARGRNDLYVALTRATHRLGVVHCGPVPPELTRPAPRRSRIGVVDRLLAGADRRFVYFPCTGPAYVTRYFTGTNKGRQTQVSSYPQTSNRPAAIGSARPATLMAAIGAAVVAGLAAILNGVLVIATGPDIVIDIAAKVAGVSRSELERSLGGSARVDAFKSAAESDYNIIKNRAIAVLICGVLLLAAGLLMRKAALWARILVTLVGLATAGFSLLIASKPDEGTTMMIVLGWLATLVAVVAIITSWLPANARYAKSAR